MPLVPRDHGGEVEVNIGEDTYWLHRYLGWYAREQAGMNKAFSINVPWSQVRSGALDRNPDEIVALTITNLEDVRLTKLKVWLSRWSHKEPITDMTLRRLPAHHAKKLLAEIDKLEKEQDGPTADSPLAASSKKSSGKS